MCKCQRARELCNVLLQFAVVVVIVICATKIIKRKDPQMCKMWMWILACDQLMFISKGKKHISVSRLSVFFRVWFSFYSFSIHNYLDNDNLKLALKDTKGFEKWFEQHFVLILIKIRYFAINWNFFPFLYCFLDFSFIIFIIF